MKRLLPDTMAARAMALLVLGLAVTHLVSNLFYATDRESALLAAGGEHAIQWIAATGAFADAVAPEDLPALLDAARSDRRFVTVTGAPAAGEAAAGGWREAVLQRELRRHAAASRLDDFRVAFAPRDATGKAIDYWRGFFARNGLPFPGEMILASRRLDSGRWLNVAAPVQAPPRFFSARLGLSMAVMLVAVVLISALIVRRMTDPLMRLSRAAEKLGANVQAPAIPETGPEEVRRTAHAFNVMQRRIRRFVEDRTQMLGAIAHDLGTPITRLRLRAEFVEDADLRAKMLRDLDDMQQMVASTLAFIRDDATSEPPARVDLGSLLARVCDDFKDSGADVDLAEVPRWVLLDCRPVALRRALGNVIDNAIKYAGGARVSLRLAPDRLRILVDDRGPGIPGARREDVFQPFRRLEESRSRATGGAGLGLAVARTILRAHGGDIRLADRPGGGLRVELRLPRADPPGDAAGEAGATPAAPRAPGPGPGQTARSAATAGLVARPAAGAGTSIKSGIETCLPIGRATTWKTL